MRKLKKLLMGALLTGGSFFLITSCGTESTDVSSESGAKYASLTLAAKFPSKGIESQYISKNIGCIEYEIFEKSLVDNYYSYNVIKRGILSPTQPSTTIENLPVGPVHLRLLSTDGQPSIDGEYCTGKVIDDIKSYAELSEGNNTFNITMISNVRWQFVDSNGNPISIRINKTNPDATEEISYFDINVPYSYEIFSTSIDQTKPAGFTYYKFDFFGQNFYVNPNSYDDTCQSDTQCTTYGSYYLQLIGPNTTNNGLSFNMPLSPYTDANGNVWERELVAIGAPVNYEESYSGYYTDIQFNLTQNDGTDVYQELQNYFTTVTSADTIEGTLLELAVNKSTETETYTCAWDMNFTDTFECPFYITDMFYQSLAKKALENISSSPSTLALDSNGCYQNVNVSETLVKEEGSGWYCDFVTYTDNNGNTTYEWICDYNLDGVLDRTTDDTNGDGIVDDNDKLTFYIKEDYTATLNICLIPFTAKATDIPTSNLDVQVQ